jgi:hypothetical protein
VLPLSYRDAVPLLRALRGPLPPADFVGSLQGLEYRLGPSELTVHMRTNNTMPIGEVRNVLATWRGEHYGTARDRPVILVGCGWRRIGALTWRRTLEPWAGQPSGRVSRWERPGEG